MNSEACAENHQTPRGDVTVLYAYPGGATCILCNTQLRIIQCDHCGHSTLRIAADARQEA